MRRHLLVLIVAAAAVVAVQAIPIEPSDSDSALTPVHPDSDSVDSEKAPGSQRQGRFLLLKLLAAKLLAAGTKKKAVAATAGVAGVAGVAGTAGVAGLGGAGPVYVDAGGLAGQQVVTVDGSVLGGSHSVLGGSHSVLGGSHSVLGGSHSVVSLGSGLSGGVVGAPNVVAVDGSLSGGLTGGHGVFSVDAGLSSGLSVDAVPAGLANSGVVGVIQVPDKVHKEEGFFSTALKLPGLAVSSIVDTASSTASSIKSAASTVFSLPAKAGQVIVDTVDGLVHSLVVGSTYEPEYAVGTNYVPNSLVYKESAVVQQPHHIVVPIVVKGLHHSVDPAPVDPYAPIPVDPYAPIPVEPVQPHVGGYGNHKFS